jgi:hypothetical protein
LLLSFKKTKQIQTPNSNCKGNNKKVVLNTRQMNIVKSDVQKSEFRKVLYNLPKIKRNRVDTSKEDLIWKLKVFVPTKKFVTSEYRFHCENKEVEIQTTRNPNEIFCPNRI